MKQIMCFNCGSIHDREKMEMQQGDEFTIKEQAQEGTLEVNAKIQAKKQDHYEIEILQINLAGEDRTREMVNDVYDGATEGTISVDKICDSKVVVQ